MPSFHIKDGTIKGIYCSELAKEIDKIRKRQDRSLLVGQIRLGKGSLDTPIGYVYQISIHPEEYEVCLFEQAEEIGSKSFGNEYFSTLDAVREFITANDVYLHESVSMSDYLVFAIKQENRESVTTLVDALLES